MTTKMSSDELKKLRKSIGLNQSQFWSAVNVTQSGGSRYESGRKMPATVAIMVDLVHVRGVKLDELPSADDIKLLNMIKARHQDLYHNLKLIVAASNG